MPLNLAQSAFLSPAFSLHEESKEHSLEKLAQWYSEPADYGANIHRDTLKHGEVFSKQELEFLAKFNSQMDKLTQYFLQSCERLCLAEWYCSNFIAFIERIKTRDYYIGQSAKFYASCKESIEDIALYLHAADSEQLTEAKSPMMSLLADILHCSSGVHYHLKQTYNLLAANSSLQKTIASFRTLIIEQLAADHLSFYNISLNDIKHVNNVFLRFAAGEGWNPLGCESLNDFNEVHENLALVQPQDLEWLTHEFLAHFTPVSLVNYLANFLRNQVLECLKKKKIAQNLNINQPIVLQSMNDFIPLLHNLPISELTCFFEATEEESPETVIITESKWGKTFYTLKNIADIALEIVRFFCEKESPLLKSIQHKNHYVLIPYAAELSYVYQDNVLLPLQRASSALPVELDVFRENHIFIYPPQFRHFLDSGITDFEKCHFHSINFEKDAFTKLNLRSCTFIDCQMPPPLFLELFGWSRIQKARCDAQSLEELRASIPSLTDDEKGEHLHLAVMLNDAVLCDQLIAANAYRYIGNNSNKVPLDIALALSHWDCVTALITNLDLADENKALYSRIVVLACIENHTETVLKLLPYQPLLTTCINRNTALHNAAMHGNCIIVRALLNAGADRHAKNNDGFNPFQLAAACHHWDCVKVFIEHDENDVSDYSYLILLATQDSAEEVVALLAAKKPALNWSMNDSVLSIAVLKQNLKVLESLLSIATLPLLAFKNSRGLHAIDHLAKSKSLSMLVLFAKYKFLYLMTDTQLKEAFILAETHQHNELVEHIASLPAFTRLFPAAIASSRLEKAALEDNVVAVKAYQTLGGTCSAPTLEQVTIYGHWDCLSVLLTNEKNLHDKNILTFIFNLALLTKKFVLALLIIKQKVDVNQPLTANNNRPLHWAVINNHPQLFAGLLANGADLQLTNSENQTAIDLMTDNDQIFLKLALSTVIKIIPANLADLNVNAEFKQLYLKKLLQHLLSCQAALSQRTFFSRAKNIFDHADVLPILSLISYAKNAITLKRELSEFLLKSGSEFHRHLNRTFQTIEASQAFSFQP